MKKNEKTRISLSTPEWMTTQKFSVGRSIDTIVDILKDNLKHRKLIIDAVTNILESHYKEYTKKNYGNDFKAICTSCNKECIAIPIYNGYKKFAYYSSKCCRSDIKVT